MSFSPKTWEGGKESKCKALLNLDVGLGEWIVVNSFKKKTLFGCDKADSIQYTPLVYGGTKLWISAFVEKVSTKTPSALVFLCQLKHLNA